MLTTARAPPDERRRLRARSYPVETTTIDDYVERTGRVPDFVKVDAEGAELDILRGMGRTLHDAAPMLSLETGDYDDMQSPATAESIGFLENSVTAVTSTGASCSRISADLATATATSSSSRASRRPWG